MNTTSHCAIHKLLQPKKIWQYIHKEVMRLIRGDYNNRARAAQARLGSAAWYDAVFEAGNIVAPEKYRILVARLSLNWTPEDGWRPGFGPYQARNEIKAWAREIAPAILERAITSETTATTPDAQLFETRRQP